MKVTLEPTDELFKLGNGIICRVWKATSANGATASFLVAGVAVDKGVDPSEFEPTLVARGSLAKRLDGVYVVDVSDKIDPGGPLKSPRFRANKKSRRK